MRFENIDKLTEREKDCYKLLKKGTSNRDISKKMSVTEGTVKSFCNSIFRKLAINNRYAIIVNGPDIGEFTENTSSVDQPIP